MLILSVIFNNFGVVVILVGTQPKDGVTIINCELFFIKLLFLFFSSLILFDIIVTKLFK